MNKANFEMVLAELKSHHERTMNGVDSLKGTAGTLMGAASVGLPLLTAARLVSPGTGLLPDDLRLPLILLSAVGYVALMVLCLIVIGPTRLYGPMRTTWEEIVTFYLSQEEEDARKTLLEQYIKISSLNQAVLRSMVGVTRAAGALLVIDTVLLLILL